jgi:hypothetical protein
MGNANCSIISPRIPTTLAADSPGYLYGSGMQERRSSIVKCRVDATTSLCNANDISTAKMCLHLTPL